MKKNLLLIIALALLSAPAAAQVSELDADQTRLAEEIASLAPAAGLAGPEGRLIAEVERRLTGGEMRKDAGPVIGDEYLRLIDFVWALGETGGAEAAWVLGRGMPSADPTLRLNMAAALNKIEARTGYGGNGAPELVLSHLEPGDIVFRKGYFGLLNSAIGAQTVGHVGVYVGVENGEHMVIEGWLPVRKVTLKYFVGSWPYYGNRTTSPRPTAAQRDMIVDYVREKLGRGYDMSHVVQKGPEKFDCVGLAEAAYEAAGLNPTPDDFESGWGWPLTPTEQYEHTYPNF